METCKEPRITVVHDDVCVLQKVLLRGSFNVSGNRLMKLLSGNYSTAESRAGKTQRVMVSDKPELLVCWSMGREGRPLSIPITISK